MRAYGFIGLFMFTLGLTLTMESMPGPKKSLAALLAEKRNHRRVILLYGHDDSTGGSARHYLTDQQDQFTRYASGMTERDIDVLTITASTLTEPDRRFLMAAPYHLNPTQPFQGWLIGKDGGVKDRFDKPITPQDLFREVDRMPMRKQEMRHQ